jgi:hypothetical protein
MNNSNCMIIRKYIIFKKRIIQRKFLNLKETDFINTFQTFKLRHIISNFKNNETFKRANSFVSMNNMNYVFEHTGADILVYNEYWLYEKTVSFTNPLAYSTYFSDVILVTGIFDKLLLTTSKIYF